MNANWNSDNRDWNLNANDLDDNRWNDGNCVFSRSLFFSSSNYFGEVFSMSCFNQPPSILLISSSFSESIIYFLLLIFDHRILRTATKRRMVKRIKENSKSDTISSYLGLIKHGNTIKLKIKVFGDK